VVVDLLISAVLWTVGRCS